MALTPQEFTEALCQYGIENNLNLVVTKERLTPKFEIDGIEYEATRSFGRFGAVIQCTMTHPALLEQEYSDLPQKRSNTMRTIYRAIGALTLPVSLFIYFAVSRGSIPIALLLCAVELPMLWFYFRNFKQN